MSQLGLFAEPAADPRYDHVWRWGRPAKGHPPYDPPRKGRRCRVRCRGRGRGPLNVAVEMHDGELVCAPRWAVRAAKADCPPQETHPGGHPGDGERHEPKSADSAETIGEQLEQQGFAVKRPQTAPKPRRAEGRRQEPERVTAARRRAEGWFWDWWKTEAGAGPSRTGGRDDEQIRRNGGSE